MVEVNPLFDSADVTSHVAVRLAFDFLGTVHMIIIIFKFYFV